MSLYLLYHLITVHALYIAPLYGWFLFVSAAVRRAPFVWAFVPPIALCAVERIAFGTKHLTNLLLNRFQGNGMDALTVSGTFPMHPMTHLTPLRFLSSAGLLVGLVIFAAFVAAAVRLRKAQGPA
jgi:ABC-2 type transport system permease protein